MPSKPKNADVVYQTMKDYSHTKEFSFSESELRYMAEDFFLFWEGRRWDKIKYWPAVAMKRVLNLNANRKPSPKHSPVKASGTQEKSKSVRDKVLEKQNDF